MRTGQEFGADPPTEGHHGVMVQVQERYLIVLFPQHEKYLFSTNFGIRCDQICALVTYSVQQLCDLAEEVPPHSPRHLEKY